MTATLDPVQAGAQPAKASSGDPAPTAIPTRSFRVFRTHPAAAPTWDRFDVPVVSDRMTILDALTWIRARLDPTLDVRHSCFHASCGTCGMRVDGREALACVTRLGDLRGGEITVEPLLNQPVVSDLVVDIEELYEAFDEIGMPLVRRSELVAGSHPADGVEALERFEDCIECGLCLSACPVAASDAAYAGPGVLAAAWRVIEEPRGMDTERTYDLVDGDQGAWRCHLAFECTEACPSDGQPASQIAHLRRGLLGHRIRTVLGRRRVTGSGG